ncbi:MULTISPECIES: MMPL family transporter [unclassified Streptomyces]|uniref:MMPL family transporter n=1 Tax=unclassified Streptomyces TaxID=2593676 RepID=UPI002E2B4945|nr:MMPL family transporter [Streptomyces sp. NBC_00223]
MLNRLANSVLAKPKRILLVTLLVVLCAGSVAGGLTSRLTMGGYESSSTQSAKAATVLQDTFKQGEPNLTLLVTDPRGIDDPAVAEAGQALTQQLAGEKDVTNVVSYWSSGKATALRGTAGKQALVLARINGDFNHVVDRADQLRKSYTGKVQGLHVELGGNALMWKENTSQATKDSTKAESIVFPVVMIVLVLIFGSLVAAAFPLAVAFATMLLVMGLLWALTFFMEASNFVSNVTTFLGLGLAIDYSLLFMTRYREERGLGAELPEAIRTTIRTVGRTVIFSATTLAVSFAALLALPFTMFRSLAVGALLTALAAAAGTLIIVPSLLVWAGPRVEKFRLVRRRARPVQDGEGFWHRLAVFVMRRPVPVLLVVLAFLTLLGSPVFGMKLRLPDEQVLPKSAQSATVLQEIHKGFNTQEQQAIQVVATGIGSPSSRTADIDAYAQRLSGIPGVARVDALTGSYARSVLVAPPTAGSQQFAAADATYLSVVPSVDGYSQQGKALVGRLHAAKAPFKVILGGAPAVSVDTFRILADRLPISLAILVIGSFILLFLLTGSVLLPLKAIVLSTLSLAATFGALVFIFQNGHLQWLVGGFIVTGAITWTVPVLVFAISFGLSMDYEVFMLSRIKEEYDRTGNNEQAVAVGLERVGKVVTYAALLLSIVFVALATSSISYLKAIGIGLPLAVLMDATLIRGAMLPALMRLMGRANWWAPGPLRRFHQRFGISEEPAVRAAPADEPALESQG